MSSWEEWSAQNAWNGTQGAKIQRRKTSHKSKLQLTTCLQERILQPVKNKIHLLNVRKNLMILSPQHLHYKVWVVGQGRAITILNLAGGPWCLTFVLED